MQTASSTELSRLSDLRAEHFAGNGADGSATTWLEISELLQGGGFFFASATDHSGTGLIKPLAELLTEVSSRTLRTQSLLPARIRRMVHGKGGLLTEEEIARARAAMTSEELCAWGCEVELHTRRYRLYWKEQPHLERPVVVTIVQRRADQPESALRMLAATRTQAELMIRLARLPVVTEVAA